MQASFPSTVVDIRETVIIERAQSEMGGRLKVCAFGSGLTFAAGAIVTGFGASQMSNEPSILVPIGVGLMVTGILGYAVAKTIHNIAMGAIEAATNTRSPVAPYAPRRPTAAAPYALRLSEVSSSQEGTSGGEVVESGNGGIPLKEFRATPSNTDSE